MAAPNDVRATLFAVNIDVCATTFVTFLYDTDSSTKGHKAEDFSLDGFALLFGQTERGSCFEFWFKAGDRHEVAL